MKRAVNMASDVFEPGGGFVEEAEAEQAGEEEQEYHGFENGEVCGPLLC